MTVHAPLCLTKVQSARAEELGLWSVCWSLAPASRRRPAPSSYHILHSVLVLPFRPCAARSVLVLPILSPCCQLCLHAVRCVFVLPARLLSVFALPQLRFRVASSPRRITAGASQNRVAKPSNPGPPRWVCVIRQVSDCLCSKPAGDSVPLVGLLRDGRIIDGLARLGKVSGECK